MLPTILGSPGGHKRKRAIARVCHPIPIQVNPSETEDLYFALNATTHALQFAASAAECFTADSEELERSSLAAASIAYIKNHLSDAQGSLAEAEGEIGRLIQQRS